MRRGWAAALREENRDLRRRVVELEGERDTKLAVIKLLEDDIRTRDERIADLKREASKLGRECDTLREMLGERDQQVRERRAENERLRGERDQETRGGQ